MIYIYIYMCVYVRTFFYFAIANALMHHLTPNPYPSLPPSHFTLSYAFIMSFFPCFSWPPFFDRSSRSLYM
ncbi:hypothetical protein F4775DRAFT_543470 [Biscogniauxia sp. FL1348]|nr:hypothetical protein F4775DRAFT_543470 [Biscogniauxia sp. FL1348]